VEYRVVSSLSASGLQAEVNRLIGDGWVPQGGLVAAGGTLTQALVLDADAGVPATTSAYREVVITSAGENKIAVIKVIRKALGYGLKEAKACVDRVPSSLGVQFTQGNAEGLQRVLENAGARAEIR
jgi:large subunit ribosomal protein L7/L12